MESNSVTVVSFFFDIGKLENNNQRRQSSNYKETSEKLLKRNINLIFFGEEETILHVWNIRKKYNLLDKTYLVTCNLMEISPYIKHLPLLEKVYRETGLNGFIDCKRMTPMYFICIWTKFYAIKKSIELNPFNSDKFCWIDYGVFHISSDINDYDFIKNLTSLPNDKIRIMNIQQYNRNMSNTKKEFYSRDNCAVTAQIFGGPKNNMLEFCDLFNKELQVSIDLEQPTNEENIMAMVSFENQEKFDFTCGFYSRCLTDFSSLKTLDNFDRMFYNAENYRNQGFNWISYSILEKIKNSYHFNSELSNEQICKVYKELIIVSYYAVGITKYRAIVEEFRNFCDRQQIEIDDHTRNNMQF